MTPYNALVYNSEDWKRYKKAGKRAFLMNGLRDGLGIGLFCGAVLSLVPGPRPWTWRFLRYGCRFSQRYQRRASGISGHSAIAVAAAPEGAPNAAALPSADWHLARVPSGHPSDGENGSMNLGGYLTVDELGGGGYVNYNCGSYGANRDW